MRDQLIAEWLAQSPWADRTVEAIQGDASARSYARLIHPSDEPLILMDAPPDSCGSQESFVVLAEHLRSLGLCAPIVHDWDETLGLLCLEDLGPTDMAQHLVQSPGDEISLYQATTDVLLKIGSAPPPKCLPVMTPTVAGDMIAVAFDWVAVDATDQERADLTGLMTEVMEKIDPQPKCLSLRDFHSENLIWRPNKAGTDRIGLLDFQDAFVTHPAYDLASLLRDARRDVDPQLVPILIKEMTDDTERFREAFHIIAIQRNVRILGIFSRLAKRDRKRQYEALLPRVRRYIAEDLKPDIAAPLRPLITRLFLESA
ncbi:MAG: phosphotransferase [Pseudomonadota bacterium]